MYQIGKFVNQFGNMFCLNPWGGGGVGLDPGTALEWGYIYIYVQHDFYVSHKAAMLDSALLGF